MFGPVLQAQTFNLRYDFDGALNPEVLWNVELMEDGYFIVGGAQEELNLPFGIWAHKLDFQGAIESSHFISNEIDTWFPGWSNSTFPDAQGNYILGGSSSEGINSGLAVLFNSVGDTLWTKNIIDSSAENGICYAAIQSQDLGYLLVGLFEPDTEQTNGVVYKLSADGELSWTNQYALNTRQHFLSVANLSDGGYLLGGASLVQGNSYDTWLVRIDSNGQEIWSKTYEDLSGETDGEAHLVNNLTDSYVFSTYLSSSAVSGYPSIVKVNPSNGETIWQKIYGDDNYDTALTSIKAVNGGEGYIASGITNLNNSGYNGLILRVNEDGDSLWMRQYQWIDGCNSFFRDVIPSENGGFVAVGFVEPIDSVDLSQDAWIVKTDENGCIVPGCDVGIEEFDLDQRLLIYPNPAADIVNFHFQSKVFLNGANLEILDITGKTVLTENFSASEITLMMDASKLPSGLYFVRVVSEGEVLLTEKLEKW